MDASIKLRQGGVRGRGPAHGYEHLQTEGRTHFHNRFDRGWILNTLEFWSGRQEKIDWDAMRVAVDAGEVPSPPPLSYSWFHSNASGRIPGWLRYLFHFHRAIPRHDPSHQGHGQGLPIISFSAST